MKRILFVDDEKNILDALRRMFHAQRARWEMHFALGGEAALQLCEQHPFNVVITDMRMPGMDGPTLLAHVRDRFPDAARLVLSGYSETALSARAAHVAYRVLAKPCDQIELQAAIERVCTLQDIFCTPEIRKIIGAIGDLPSLSCTYKALAVAIDDPSTSTTCVAKIVEKDVAMAAKVLQLVNSGFFGLARTFTTVQHAVEYLGMDTMKNLALASDTFRVFTPDPRIPSSFCETMQAHARRTALVVGVLPLDPQARDIAIVSAVLHDVGALVLASHMPGKFCAALDRATQSGCSQFEAEEAVIGTSHADIGAYLLGLWGIHSAVVEAVAHHHRPTRIAHDGLDSSAAVYLADLLAQELHSHAEDTEGAQLSTFDRECLKTLGLLDEYPFFREQAVEAICSA